MESILYLALSGKKLINIFEPSSGGTGIKLKIANNKFKKQKIIAIKKIVLSKLPEIKEFIKLLSPDR